VLLSGGLDSATTLAIAKHDGFDCYTLTIDYYQRHRAEIDTAGRIARVFMALQHQILKIDPCVFGGSALTDPKLEVPTTPATGIPTTYVPARNTVMLALALAWCETLQARDIFIGVNAIDYSGYPDCRPEYIRAFEGMANLATKSAVEGRKFHIRAPLIDMSKAEIIARGITLGVDFSQTVSCYQATPDGLACGCCDACRLRRAGFVASGIVDSTRYVTR